MSQVIITSASRAIVSILGLSLLVAMSGCVGSVDADYDKLGLVNVSGVVTLDGQPLPNAVVKFESSDGTFCYGQTNASGVYALKLNSEKLGVIPGEKVVRISTTASTGEEEGQAAEEDPDAKASAQSKKELVPDCYHKNSKLKATVSTSEANFNFDLKSDCSVTGRT